MTLLLEQAIQHVLTLPPEAQDDAARLLLRLAPGAAAVYRLTEEESADLDAADAEIARGDLATTAEVDEVFAKHRS